MFPKSSVEVVVLAQMVSQHLPHGLRFLVLCLHFSPRLQEKGEPLSDMLDTSLGGRVPGDLSGLGVDLLVLGEVFVLFCFEEGVVPLTTLSSPWGLSFHPACE